MNEARVDAAIIERRDELLRAVLLVMARHAGYAEPETIVAQCMAGEPVRDRIGAHGTMHFDHARAAITLCFRGFLS